MQVPEDSDEGSCNNEQEANITDSDDMMTPTVVTGGKTGSKTGGSRCIYIDSVDSGRSSDTGTHQSWTSSSGSSTKSSTKSASDSAKAAAATGAASSAAAAAGGINNPNNVQIVPHTFCDYLGSIKRRISPSSTG